MKRFIQFSTVALAIVLLVSCAGSPPAKDAAGPAGDDSALSALDEGAKSNVMQAFAQAEKDIKNREIKIGAAKSGIYLDAGVLVKDYSSGTLIAMRDPADWYAFALTGPIATLFKEKGAEVLGAPVSDEFPVEGGTKQIFTKGFVLVASDAATWTDSEFAEPAAPPANIGKLMAGDEVIDPLDQEVKDRISRAFREAYRLALVRGFNPGTPPDLVHQWDGPVTQNCIKGDSYSVGNTWSLMNVSVFLMPLDGRNAYIVKDIFADTYSIGRGQGANSGPFGYGSAISDEYVKDGFICQNYEKTINQSNPDGTMDIIYK